MTHSTRIESTSAPAPFKQVHRWVCWCGKVGEWTGNRGRALVNASHHARTHYPRRDLDSGDTMSTSTDAILFYGYCWDDQVDFWPDDEETDWEERYANLAGPDKPFCTIGRHCSGDYPMPYVAVGKTVMRAWRGEPRSIDTDLHSIPLSWRDELDKFCALMGIDVSDKHPGWFLVSWWS